MKKSKKFTMKEVEWIAKNIKVNKELDKYENVVLFPEKLAKANEIIKKIKLPK